MINSYNYYYNNNYNNYNTWYYSNINQVTI